MKEILMKQIFVEAKSGQIDFVSHASESSLVQGLSNFRW